MIGCWIAWASLHFQIGWMVWWTFRHVVIFIDW
jgi:hypothetical protein